MLKDITLGQYFPGNSVVHRMDPRVKLIITLIFIVILFMAKGALAYVVCGGGILLVMAVAKLKLRLVMRGAQADLLYRRVHRRTQYFLHSRRGFVPALGSERYQRRADRSGVYDHKDHYADYVHFAAHLYHFAHAVYGCN